MKRYRNTYSKEVRDEGLDLLRKSCICVISRSRQTEGSYANVKCSFKIPLKLRLSLREDKKFMDIWFYYTKIYLENGKDRNFRPVIDRIDGNGHYYRYNIQPLSYMENSRKARRKRN